MEYDMTNEVRATAELIIKTHDGQAYFNFGEISKILGCGINTVPALLHNSGITVKKVGPSKRVSAYEIAALMCSKRIAPIDNTSKGA